MTSRKPNHELLAALVEYFNSTINFNDPAYALVCALYTILTWVWQESLDVLPYLVIRSATKQSGKTTLLELFNFVVKMPQYAIGMTGASLMRLMDELHPTLLSDEAEDLNRASSNKLRQAMNIGYKRGATMPVTMGKSVVQFEPFGPKIIALIGDVYDTLRDRSIMLTMVRRPPPSELERSAKEAMGGELKEKLAAWAGLKALAVRAKLAELPKLPFLVNSRDVEIWRPMFVLCEMLDASLRDELVRVAVDISADKTAPAQVYLENSAAEEEATASTWGTKLVRDIAQVMDSRRYLWSTDLLKRLADEPAMPWRRYGGNGLNEKLLAQLVGPFGLRPRLIRDGKKVQRGYYREDVEKAIQTHLTV